MEALVREGANLLKATNKEGHSSFMTGYQQWYTQALGAVRSLIPDREADFRRHYDRDLRRKHYSPETYSLEDYVQGLGPAPDAFGKAQFDVHLAAFVKFQSQLAILASAEARLGDILANIREVLQADLFDSELDAARHLLTNGYDRAAGAVAGVVLEGHLAQVCGNHGVVIRKKDAHISDFNDALKKADVLDVTQWRGIQRLSDIRNLCDHKKQREPTPDEVDELISRVDKAIKTLM
ncbi:MAG: hypothetical protein Q7T33_13960 [Dehalococcoidia bacterium]|nr:hypothetical protein [Dehalococcoidia bacterium]